MNTISPKMVRALTTAIVRKAHKHFPGAGVVGVYSFENKTFTRKAELRVFVQEWCESLTYEQVPLVRKNFNLL